MRQGIQSPKIVYGLDFLAPKKMEREREREREREKGVQFDREKLHLLASEWNPTWES